MSARRTTRTAAASPPLAMMHVRTGVTAEVERKVWRTSCLGYWKIPLMGDGGDTSGAHNSNGGNGKGKLTEPTGE